jgi:hypothetical protein
MSSLEPSLSERLAAIRAAAKEAEPKTPEPIRSIATNPTSLHIYLRILTGYERAERIKLDPYIPYETLKELYEYLAPIEIPIYPTEILAKYLDFVIPIDISTIASILWTLGASRDIQIRREDIKRTVLHCLLEEVL